MISAQKIIPKGRLFSPGMTLLELVVALTLIVLLLSLGLVAYNGRADDDNLRRAVIEIESLSSRARTVSFLKQVPHRLSITSTNTIKFEEPTGAEGYKTLEQFSAEGIRLSLRRWGARDDEWQFYEGKNSGEAVNIDWYFSPTGLCEPISLRLEEGESWVVLHMDPLTGRVQEEESHIQ